MELSGETESAPLAASVVQVPGSSSNTDLIHGRSTIVAVGLVFHDLAEAYHRYVPFGSSTGRALPPRQRTDCDQSSRTKTGYDHSDYYQRQATITLSSSAVADRLPVFALGRTFSASAGPTQQCSSPTVLKLLYPLLTTALQGPIVLRLKATSMPHLECNLSSAISNHSSTANFTLAARTVAAMLPGHTADRRTTRWMSVEANQVISNV
ncbi:hypothetical protein PDE_00068 [Penicillium oxalicum 114-2]|uniref:Uncharacterized protein n=1 Tax=Penicillium oxalicum (strain 114-2 / CGMCC 5302) TaxID=933388 RepID=S8ATI7_PENO1|nr:hypothetical protein PDE_00068 [Penicillium oxalicum 114-2]